MGKKKEDSDDFTLLGDVAEGFADIVDGSIFDFDGPDVTPDTKEKESDGDDNSERPAKNSGGQRNRGTNGGPAPKPGEVAGVTIGDSATGSAKKKGKGTGDKVESGGKGGKGSKEGDDESGDGDDKPEESTK